MATKRKRRKKEPAPEPEKSMEKDMAEEKVMEVKIEESAPKRKPGRPPKKVRVRPARNDMTCEERQLLSFKAWFTNKMSMDRRLKEHHFDQIRTYMLGLGLGDREESFEYERALKGYFGG